MSRAGETRRGRDGDSWDVGLKFGVACVGDRGLETLFVSLPEPWDGPSESRASAVVHASRS